MLRAGAKMQKKHSLRSQTPRLAFGTGGGQQAANNAVWHWKKPIRKTRVTQSHRSSPSRFCLSSSSISLEQQAIMWCDALWWQLVGRILSAAAAIKICHRPTSTSVYTKAALSSTICSGITTQPALLKRDQTNDGVGLHCRPTVGNRGMSVQ